MQDNTEIYTWLILLFLLKLLYSSFVQPKIYQANIQQIRGAKNCKNHQLLLFKFENTSIEQAEENNAQGD